ncbi:MAG: KH domain-containing protein, partial [Anaerolineae bacterium]|nr:KH domain-containing protein [Anaerolineae bacterium]
MRYEVRGQTVDEAIEAGLAKLGGLKRSDVIVDVVDEGSRGILGLGARDAVVRLLPMATPAPPPAPPPAPEKKAEPVRSAPPPPTSKSTQSAPAPRVSSPSSPAKVERTPPPASTITSEELELERDTAVTILQTMLQQMQIEAQISTAVTEPDEVTGQPINLIDITGADLGVLIGPRGDTLASLQYVTRLMTSNQLKAKADFVIDVEGYRERRKQALARLADRMASKVIKQGRPVSLEPMPANERRVIHMTLRDHAAVYTQSTG